MSQNDDLPPPIKLCHWLVNLVMLVGCLVGLILFGLLMRQILPS